MFEARVGQGVLLKKILDSVKDLVSDANWDCGRCVIPRRNAWTAMGVWAAALPCLS